MSNTDSKAKSCLSRPSCLARSLSIRRSFNLRRIQRHSLNLSVLKLDGSQFEVRVAKTATVAELKKAVEDVFNHSPDNRHLCISWSHVWGHFCLCHEGFKLVDDNLPIQLFGIRDEDQLLFVQHLSTSYNHEKTRVKHRSKSLECKPLVM